MSMTEKQREVYRLHVDERLSLREIARRKGVNYGSIRNTYIAAKGYVDAPEGQKAAIETAGLDINSAKHGWRVIRHEDGSRDSVFWKSEQTPDDIGERIKAVLEDIKPAPPVTAPTHRASDLLTVYPIADAHIGMRAWGKEAGEDYDTDIATKRLQNWIGQAIAASPPSETAIIVDIGDLTHADDQDNQTKRGKHILDVDTRFFRTLDETIETLVIATHAALQKHKKVIVRILPGNHNPTAYMAILFGLAGRYRDEPRVDVQKAPGEFFAHRFGVNMICAHHGDKAKAERLVLMMADDFPEMWGTTRHRFIFTGHLHHHKSADIGGAKWEQLRAVSARDAYATSHAYASRAQLNAITYHKEKGEVGRVSVNS